MIETKDTQAGPVLRTVGPNWNIDGGDPTLYI